MAVWQYICRFYTFPVESFCFTLFCFYFFHFLIFSILKELNILNYVVDKTTTKLII